MSHAAIELVTGLPIATVFYGGADRGKVVQLHMSAHHLEREPEIVEFLIEDSDSGFVESLGEWLRRETVDAGMILFTEVGAELKVSTIEIEVRP